VNILIQTVFDEARNPAPTMPPTTGLELAYSRSCVVLPSAPRNFEPEADYAIWTVSDMYKSRISNV
jgi:hypothetical protein